MKKKKTVADIVVQMSADGAATSGHIGVSVLIGPRIHEVSNFPEYMAKFKARLDNHESRLVFVERRTLGERR